MIQSYDKEKRKGNVLFRFNPWALNRMTQYEISIGWLELIIQGIFFRLLRLHHAEAEGYELLENLLKFHVSHDVWSLYVPNLSRPCAPSLSYLSHHLHNVPMPTATSKTKHKLRYQLLEWLLPASDEFSDTPDQVLMGKSGSSEEEQLRAEILVTLMLSDTTRITLPCVDNKTENKFDVIEDTYLWIKNSEDKDTAAKSQDCTNAERVMEEMWQKGLDLIKQETTALLQLTEELDVSKFNYVITSWGEGILWHFSLPNPFLLNKICLN